MEKSEINYADPILQPIITLLEQPIIHSTHDVFHDLMSCIIEQQIHYRSTKKIFAKALEKAGVEHLTIGNFHLLEQHSFPQMPLAAGKYETMMAFMEYWNRNILDFNELSEERIVAELSAIKGVGRWTIDMILLYTLKRPNIFPADDFHLKQVMVSLYQLDPKVKLKAQLLQVAENWGNHKSLAVLYLLEWKKYKKGLSCVR